MPRSRPFPPSQQKEGETRAETTDLLQNNRFTSANAIIAALQATDVQHLAKNLTSLRNQWTIRHDEEGKVASDDERLLLAKQYLQQSPTAAEIFNAWEYLSKHSIVHQHLAIGVFSSLLTLLSSQYIYHSIGLTVLRALLQPQSSRKLNAHLNSSQTDLVLVALKLWNAMANFGGGTERKQVFEEFSWGNKSLFRLFHMRRKGQVDLSADPFIKPDIRTLYISFILQFVQPSTLFIVKTAFLESHREVFLGLFKRLPEDPYLLVRKILEICWDGIWSDNRLKRTIKIGLFGDQTLNQIIKLYSRSTAEGTDPESVPADLVHHFLLALCTRPGTGLCFKDNGWYPREEEEDEKAEELDETDGRTREDASRNKSKIYNHILNHLLKNLKPTEDARQQELTLRILQACPELVSGYWTSSNLSMEPRLSSRWLINVAWMGSIISLPVPTESFFLPGGPSNNEYKPIAPPLSTILDNVIPSQWPKTFISKGLQNNSSLVQRNTALCLAQVLEKYAIALEHLKLAEKTLEEEADSGNWASRRRELEREMRKRVPNFEVIVAFLQQKISSAEWGTDPHSEPADRALRNAMVTESALRVMWLYHRSLPDIPAEARYDVGRLLDSAVLKRFLFSLTRMNEKLDEEAEQSIPGFDAVSVLHILRLLEHNDQLTWHTNLGEGGQTHLHRLFQLYVLPLPSILSERCGNLVKLALGQGVLFDHDNDEISIWIRALPRGTRAPDARSPDGEELVDEKDAVLSILDKCIKNCSSSPWKYVEAALAIYSDRITEMNVDVEAWEEYSPSTAAGPLLMSLIEVFKALLLGNIPSPSSTLLALSTYIRRLVFGISLKQPNIQYALRLTSELEQILSRADQTEHSQTILDSITREVGLLRGSLYRMKKPVAVLDREDRQEILEFIVAVEHMHVEPHKRITTAYELIDWVRMNGQTLSQDSILQTIELIEEWFPPALRELAFHLDAFDRDTILLLCDENLGDPDLFLWIFMHASPDALTDEAVQDALADVVTSCPLDSAHSICTALLRRIEAFNEPRDIIFSVNATLALWTSILSKLGQIKSHKIYKEFAFKSSPMIKLFTSTDVPKSTNEAISNLVTTVLNATEMEDRILVKEQCAYWGGKLSHQDATSLIALKALPWIDYMPPEQNLQVLDCLLDDPITLVGDQNRVLILHSILTNLQDNRSAELDSRLGLLQRVRRLLELRKHLSDDLILHRLLCSLMYEMVPFVIGDSTQDPDDVKTETTSLDGRWKVAKEPMRPDIVDYFAQMPFKTPLDFELAIPCLYRSNLVREKVVMALITSNESPLAQLSTFKHLLRSDSTGRQDLDGLCRHIFPAVIKRAFSSNSNIETITCRQLLPRFFERLDKTWLSSQLLKEYSRSNNVESLFLVGNIAAMGILSSQATSEAMGISIRNVIPLLSDSLTSHATLRDSMSAIKNLAKGAEIDADLFDAFFNIAVKDHIANEHVMTTFSLIIDLTPQKPSSVNRLIQAILHHPEFESVAESSSRNALVSTLYSLFNTHPQNTCQPSHVSPLITIYRGTLSRSDRLILSIFRLFEKNRKYSVASLVQQWAPGSELQGNGHVRSISSLDPETVFKTCINFPQWRTLEDRSLDDERDEATLYDPVFVILLLGMIVTKDSSTLSGQDWVETFRSNAICLLLSALSSRRDDLRALGWTIFSGILQSLKEADFQEKAQTVYILDMLSRLYVYANDEDSRVATPRLATYTTLLFCHAVRCVYSPTSMLYPIISQFLLQRPEYDPTDPPMLYSLLYSSLTSSKGKKEGSWRRERHWMLRFLADGMVSSKDWTVLQRRHTWDLLASVFETYQEDRFIRLGILKVLVKLAANQRAATTLITRNSLLSWIEIQIRHRYTWPIDQTVIWLEILEALLISMDWERVEKVTRGTWRADLLRCTHHLLYGLGTILDTVLPEGVVAPLLIGAKILQRISSLTWRTLSIFDSLHQSSKILRQLEVTIFSPSDPKGGSEDPVHSLLGGWTEITQRLWLAFMAMPEGSPKNSELFDFLTARIVFQSERGWVPASFDCSGWVREEVLRNLISNM